MVYVHWLVIVVFGYIIGFNVYYHVNFRVHFFFTTLDGGLYLRTIYKLDHKTCLLIKFKAEHACMSFYSMVDHKSLRIISLIVYHLYETFSLFWRVGVWS